MGTEAEIRGRPTRRCALPGRLVDKRVHFPWVGFTDWCVVTGLVLLVLSVIPAAGLVYPYIPPTPGGSGGDDAAAGGDDLQH